MIEIFKTNIKQQNLADTIMEAIRKEFADFTINFDLNDRDCVLRIEGDNIDNEKIIKMVEGFGISCKVIPDKVCVNNKNDSEEMQEQWESCFRSNQIVWGFEPAHSTVLANELFLANGIKNVLVPGFGYGRNAQLFTDNGMNVTGIEISETAIDIAKNHYKCDVEIIHGSVTNMPFNSVLYDAVFCYGLLYLLNASQRAKLLDDSYKQLKPGGYMVFSVISKKASNYGKGKEIAPDTFENAQGVSVFFYDLDAVQKEFEAYGIQDTFEISEYTSESKVSSFEFIVAVCRKPLN